MIMSPDKNSFDQGVGNYNLLCPKRPFFLLIFMIRIILSRDRHVRLRFLAPAAGRFYPKLTGGNLNPEHMHFLQSAEINTSGRQFQDLTK